MRMLLYGGCHAQVLRDYLRLAFADEIECSLLINFDLIRSLMPFPYESLGRYDVVVYSPIDNKGDYNTSFLVEACARAGVASLCFPWLEWHGYSPGAHKGLFRDRFQWFYPELAERAAAFRGSLDEFHDEVVETFPRAAEIDAIVDMSTQRLRAAELRNGSGFSLADFVLAHFRDARLFLIPDHPSRLCYTALLRWLLGAAGFDEGLVDERLRGLPPEEPQWRWRMPIFPNVVRRLALRFDDPQWIDDEAFSGAAGLRDYLAHYLLPDLAYGPLHAPWRADMAAR